MPPPTSCDDCMGRTEAPTPNHRCHCEPQRGVAISWYNVRIGMHYQEIPTPSARNDISSACTNSPGLLPPGRPSCGTVDARSLQKNPPFPEKRGFRFENCSSQYAERKLATSRAGPKDLIRPPDHQNASAPGHTRYAERKLATSRAGPKDLIRPPDHQNASAPGHTRYAERKLATSRAGPMV